MINEKVKMISIAEEPIEVDHYDEYTQECEREQMNSPEFFQFETSRDTISIDEKVAIAKELYDAGAHMLRCNSIEGSPKYKASIDSGWNKNRSSWAAIEEWIRNDYFVGIKSPGESLQLSCVDIDNGLEFRSEVISTLGTGPLVIHESSRNIDHKCHMWYHTFEPTMSNKWAGGDIRSGSPHYIIVYNWYAIYSAWSWIKSGQAPSVDLSKLRGSNNRVVNTDGEGVLDALKNAPESHQCDTVTSIAPDIGVDVVDAAIVTKDQGRHVTMIAKIGRAVGECTSKSELNARLRVIFDAHRKSFDMGSKDEQTRIETIPTEVAGARQFANDAWSKKKRLEPVMKKFWSEINTAIDLDIPKTEVLKSLQQDIDEFVSDCIDRNWPNNDRAYEDLISQFDTTWDKCVQKRASEKELEERKNEALEKKNADALNQSQPDSNFTILINQPLGSIQSWLSAAKQLGFKFRDNTFTERPVCYIPTRFLPFDQRSPEIGGGTWGELDDSRKAIINESIGKHAFVEVQRKKMIVYNPVEVSPHKEKTAQRAESARNRWCPMTEYFQNLPPWSGEQHIHESMERGGMRIDAGPFSAAAQAFLWVMVPRNCLYPGSSKREHIVLHGENHSGKSKFVELALPPHLREYWNESFSLEGSLKQRLERSIGKALLECQEMGAGGAKDWDSIKGWMTMSEVSGERMAYKEFAKRHKLTATTIFTTNRPDLPPDDDALLTRFIWVNVLTKATRTDDGLVWQHLEELFDPKRPELGTWRDQYFAEGLARVNYAVKKKVTVSGTTEHHTVECNPTWYMPNIPPKELVNWNRGAGATFATEKSTLMDRLESAFKTVIADQTELNDPEDVVFGFGQFISTKDIKSALYCDKIGIDYKSHEEFAADAKVEVPRSEIPLIEMDKVTDKSIANAMPALSERLGVKITIGRKRTISPSGKSIQQRGWTIE